MTINDRNHVMGYLSAAPRVSTRPEAELIGPKTHVLGVIEAFESIGWKVKKFIVGDRVPVQWIVKGSEDGLQRNSIRIFVADLVRIFLGVMNSFRAYAEFGQDVDLVYERLAVLQSLGWIFKQRGILWILETNAPLSIEARSDRQSIYLGSLAKFIEKKAYQQCDVLITISDTLAEIIVQESGISPEKIVVIPNGVDINLFDPKKYAPIRFFSGFTIGFVGSFASWQGLDLLLRVVAKLITDGIDINLVLVGDGPERAAMEKTVDELGIINSVKFIGLVPQSKVPEYILGFDIGYSGQTERTEKRMYCSPIKVYEYMAMGVPVIASDYEDTRKIVKDGTGYLFELGNEVDLQNKILQAYNLRAMLPKMGSLARKEIIQHHSWNSRITDLMDAIEQKPNH